MTVTAAVDKAFAAPGRAVPATALALQADRSAKAMVFVPDAEGADTGVVESRPVEVISTAGTDLRVLGLESNEEIVATGVHMLKEGQKVRRYNGLTVEE